MVRILFRRLIFQSVTNFLSGFNPESPWSVWTVKRHGFLLSIENDTFSDYMPIDVNILFAMSLYIH